MITSVKATINGQQQTLTYNSTSGRYEATITAPSKSSFNQSGGYYGVTLTATDNAGNTTTIGATDPTLGTNLRLTVKEKVKPVITFNSIGAGATLTNNKPLIEFTVTDDDSGVKASTATLKIDSSTFSGLTQTPVTGGIKFSYTPTTGLSDGSHTLTANASDNDGNTATAATLTFKVDTTPPTLNVTSPANNTYTNNATSTVSGTTNDAQSSPVTVAITVNGTSAGAVTVNANGTFSKSVTLTEGVNTIVITATDSVGKSTSLTRTVTLDTAVPVFSSVTLTPNPVDAGATYVISVTVE